MSKATNKNRKPRPPEPIRLAAKWLALNKPARPRVRRVLFVLAAFSAALLMSMYSIAQYYIAKHAREPLTFGATFIPTYAESFGLEPKETMTAIIDDLGIKRLRLVSYWEEHEKEPGRYDFRELDWQFRLAEEKGVSVSLAVGLRQPRWPECHMPDWAERLTKAQWRAQLKDYMQTVIERYKSSPALVEYQLENEYFLQVFGICPDHSRERLVEEFEYLRSLDPTRPIIVTRSNNAVPSWPVGAPRADMIGASIYKRVWDATITKRYFEYPVPAWFYAFLAGGAELTTGRNTFIHELQTEAWLPPEDGHAMNKISSIPEQNKSLDATRLRDRFEYGVGTGMRTIDLWGVEWWYWRKEVAGDPSLWNTAKEQISRYSTSN